MSLVYVHSVQLAPQERHSFLASFKTWALAHLSQVSLAVHSAQLAIQVVHFPESNQVPFLHFPDLQVDLSVHSEHPSGHLSHFLSELMIYPALQAEHSALAGVAEFILQVLQLSVHLSHFPLAAKYPALQVEQAPINFPQDLLSLQLVEHIPHFPSALRTGFLSTQVTHLKV